MPPHSAPPHSAPRILILYGSETGTAADLAHELSRLTERHHFPTTCLSASSLSPFSSLPSWPIVIFVTATTGQGDMPANMMAFWKFLLRKKLPGDWLTHTKFTTFGCGDTGYKKFNWAVRKVHKRFLQLGGQEVAERGEGDEQHAEGIDGAFLPWSAQLLGVLLEKYPLPNDLMPIPPDQLLPPKWILELDDSVNLDTLTDITTHIHVPRPNSLLGTISRNTRVTPITHWQDVRHITIALPRHVSYVPGDTISLLPKNFSDDVSHLLALQSWAPIADQPLRLVPNPSIPPDRLPPSPITHAVAPLTLRTLLTHHLDITAVPRRSFFAIIACLSTDETQRERLKEFTDPEYVDELYDYTTRPRRSILEVLQEFNSVHVPLPMILEVLPLLRERQFSIASSQKGCQPPPIGGTMVTPSVDLLVAIVRYRTIIKRMRHGVCTRWLSSLMPGAPLTLVFNTGTLTRADDDWTRPAVMIAPGTGVAPMRALVWERVHRVPEAMGVLFFGARNRDADFFFEGEWPSALKVFTAFSRDQKAKRYVQHVLREHGREVYDALVERRGVLYVCGSSGRMPAAVREALVGVVAEIEDGGTEAAEKVVERLEKEGRWREETWG